MANFSGLMETRAAGFPWIDPVTGNLVDIKGNVVAAGGGGSGGAKYTAATIEALIAAHPASAEDTGTRAVVGTAPNQVEYSVLNGSWQPMALGIYLGGTASVAALRKNDVSYEWNGPSPGSVRRRSKNPKDRIQRTSTRLLSATTGNAGGLPNTGNSAIIQRASDTTRQFREAATCQLVNYGTSFNSITYPGLSIPFPTTGYFYIPMWLEDYEVGMKQGNYKVWFVSDTKFIVVDTEGNSMGVGTVGVAWTTGGMSFTLAVGTNANAAGDQFQIKLDGRAFTWSPVGTGNAGNNAAPTITLNATYTPSMNIVLTMSDASVVTYNFSGNAFRCEGWTYIPIWDDNDADLSTALTRTGQSFVSTFTGSKVMAGKTITQVQFQRSNFTTNSRWWIGDFVTGDKIKPIVVLTIDITDTTAFTTFQAELDRVGLKGVFRIGGFQEPFGNLPAIDAAILKGHETKNGSWSRTTLNSTSTQDVTFVTEILANHNKAVELGYANSWFSTTGNSHPQQQMMRRWLPQFGYRLMMCGDGVGYVNTLQGGADDLLFTQADGPTTLARAVSIHQGHLKLGGLRVMFFHEFVDSNPTGTAMLKSDFAAFCDRLKADVDAGLIDVMVPSQVNELLSSISQAH